MTNAIEIEGLRKHYRTFRRGTRVAVDGLDLSVPEACVYGFLGPNGSGKTTTIRCLLGLARPTSGSMELLGRSVPRDLPAVIGRVGSIVETPLLFPTMTGRRNLELLARLQRLGPSAVSSALERAGLAERGDDLVKGYSLGMRQRLGLAAALLKDPALLILDEPANGLDPAGIREIRHLLRNLAAEGRTVFVSSHLLTEVGQTCDQVAILRRGLCVASGSVADVLARRGPTGLIVKTDDLARAQATLVAAGMVAELHDSYLRVALPYAESGRVTQVLAGSGQWVTELRQDEASLEDLFLDLTSDSEVPA